MFCSACTGSWHACQFGCGHLRRRTAKGSSEISRHENGRTGLHQRGVRAACHLNPNQLDRTAITTGVHIAPENSIPLTMAKSNGDKGDVANTSDWCELVQLLDPVKPTSASSNIKRSGQSNSAVYKKNPSSNTANCASIRDISNRTGWNCQQLYYCCSPPPPPPTSTTSIFTKATEDRVTDTGAPAEAPAPRARVTKEKC